MLEKYKVEADISHIKSFLDTSLRYIKEKDRCLFTNGIEKREGHTLIDCSNNLFNHDEMDLLHDYYLFLAVTKDDKDGFWREQTDILKKELLALNINPPDDFWSCFGFSYPGSETYAIEYKGKLVIL